MTFSDLTCWVRPTLFAAFGVFVASAVEENPAQVGKEVLQETTPVAATPRNGIAASNAPAAAQGGTIEDGELLAEQQEAVETAKKNRPVSSDPVQLYGWLEKVKIANIPDVMAAKLDTGALTSSLHAEEVQVFERDGQKWVKFVITEPRVVGGKRYQMETPLVRTADIKEPGGVTERRSVVRLNFLIGERNIRAEFTLNDRRNMLCPVLLGRSAVKILGWVDPARTYLADDKIFR